MRAVKQLIEQGEGIALEFKTCHRALNRDVYETVCAFLNRHAFSAKVIIERGQVRTEKGKRLREIQ